MLQHNDLMPIMPIQKSSSVEEKEFQQIVDTYQNQNLPTIPDYEN